MTNYRIYTGELPSFEIIQSGGTYQVMFSFIDVEHVNEEGEISNDKHCRCDVVEVEVLDYSTIVAAIVRARYSQDDVEAILSNYQLYRDGSLPEDTLFIYKERYDEYQEYRITSKQVADNVINL